MSTQTRMDINPNHDEAINKALAQIRIFALETYDKAGDILNGNYTPENCNRLIVLTDTLNISALTVKIMLSAR
jgi:hypothetical protein